MLLEIDNQIEKINLFPESLLEEVNQNLKMILLTFVGSCPLGRELALDNRILDKPVNIVQNLIFANLKQTIEKNEHRVNLKKVNIENENDGKLKIKIVVEVKNEYI